MMGCVMTDKLTFDGWFKRAVEKGELAFHFVDARILSLPCGCTRERHREQFTIRWRNVEAGQGYWVHEGCGSRIATPTCHKPNPHRGHPAPIARPYASGYWSSQVSSAPTGVAGSHTESFLVGLDCPGQGQ